MWGSDFKAEILKYAVKKNHAFWFEISLDFIALVSAKFGGV